MVAEEKLYTKEKLEMGNQQSQDTHSGWDSQRSITMG
jgi:hypothetical protein